MVLEEHEVQKALEQARAAFPNLYNWEYINEENRDYLGFTLWGQFEMRDSEGKVPPLPRRFFVTLIKVDENWGANLTIGQPSYYWSSADVGDAQLLHSMKQCEKLDDAIVALKEELVSFCRTFSAI